MKGIMTSFASFRRPSGNCTARRFRALKSFRRDTHKIFFKEKKIGQLISRDNQGRRNDAFSPFIHQVYTTFSK